MDLRHMAFPSSPYDIISFAIGMRAGMGFHRQCCQKFPVDHPSAQERACHTYEVRVTGTVQ